MAGGASRPKAVKVRLILATPNRLQSLDRMLLSTAFLLVVAVLVAWACGSLKDLLPLAILLVSNFSGAALAALKIEKDAMKKEIEQPPATPQA